MTNEEIIIIGAIATVFAGFGGATLGACLTYKSGIRLIQRTHGNAIELMQRQEFNKAAAEFRIAFIPEQRLLSYDSLADRTGTNAQGIIKDAINRHEIAMIRFKPFVSKAKIEAYEKAWNEYAGNSRHFEQYSAKRSLDIPEKKKLALSLINTLLNFANPKH